MSAATTRLRAVGERARTLEQIRRLRALIDAFEISVQSDYPLAEGAQAVADTACRLANTASRLDAFRLIVNDDDKVIP